MITFWPGIMPSFSLWKRDWKAVSDAMGTAAAWAKFRLFGIGETFLAETRTNSA
jgi:hypothetical protein